MYFSGMDTTAASDNSSKDAFSRSESSMSLTGASFHEMNVQNIFGGDQAHSIEAELLADGLNEWGLDDEELMQFASVDANLEDVFQAEQQVMRRAVDDYVSAMSQPLYVRGQVRQAESNDTSNKLDYKDDDNSDHGKKINSKEREENASQNVLDLTFFDVINKEHEEWLEEQQKKKKKEESLMVEESAESDKSIGGKKSLGNEVLNSTDSTHSGGNQKQDDSNHINNEIHNSRTTSSGGSTTTPYYHNTNADLIAYTYFSLCRAEEQLKMFGSEIDLFLTELVTDTERIASVQSTIEKFTAQIKKKKSVEEVTDQLYEVTAPFIGAYLNRSADEKKQKELGENSADDIKKVFRVENAESKRPESNIEMSLENVGRSQESTLRGFGTFTSNQNEKNISFNNTIKNSAKATNQVISQNSQRTCKDEVATEVSTDSVTSMKCTTAEVPSLLEEIRIAGSGSSQVILPKLRYLAKAIVNWQNFCKERPEIKGSPVWKKVMSVVSTSQLEVGLYIKKYMLSQIQNICDHTIASLAPPFYSSSQPLPRPSASNIMLIQPSTFFNNTVSSATLHDVNSKSLKQSDTGLLSQTEKCIEDSDVLLSASQLGKYAADLPSAATVCPADLSVNGVALASAQPLRVVEDGRVFRVRVSTASPVACAMLCNVFLTGVLSDASNSRGGDTASRREALLRAAAEPFNFFLFPSMDTEANSSHLLSSKDTHSPFIVHKNITRGRAVVQNYVTLMNSMYNSKLVGFYLLKLLVSQGTCIKTTGTLITQYEPTMEFDQLNGAELLEGSLEDNSARTNRSSQSRWKLSQLRRKSGEAKFQRIPPQYPGLVNIGVCAPFEPLVTSAIEGMLVNGLDIVRLAGRNDIFMRTESNFAKTAPEAGREVHWRTFACSLLPTEIAKVVKCSEQSGVSEAPLGEARFGLPSNITEASLQASRVGTRMATSVATILHSFPSSHKRPVSLETCVAYNSELNPVKYVSSRQLFAHTLSVPGLYKLGFNSCEQPEKRSNSTEKQTGAKKTSGKSKFFSSVTNTLWRTSNSSVVSTTSDLTASLSLSSSPYLGGVDSPADSFFKIMLLLRSLRVSSSSGASHGAIGEVVVLDPVALTHVMSSHVDMPLPQRASFDGGDEVLHSKTVQDSRECADTEGSVNRQLTSNATIISSSRTFCRLRVGHNSWLGRLALLLVAVVNSVSAEGEFISRFFINSLHSLYPFEDVCKNGGLEKDPSNNFDESNKVEKDDVLVIKQNSKGEDFVTGSNKQNVHSPKFIPTIKGIPAEEALLRCIFCGDDPSSLFMDKNNEEIEKSDGDVTAVRRNSAFSWTSSEWKDASPDDVVAAVSGGTGSGRYGVISLIEEILLKQVFHTDDLNSLAANFVNTHSLSALRASRRRRLAQDLVRGEETSRTAPRSANSAQLGQVLPPTLITHAVSLLAASRIAELVRNFALSLQREDSFGEGAAPGAMLVVALLAMVVAGPRRLLTNAVLRVESENLRELGITTVENFLDILGVAVHRLNERQNVGIKAKEDQDNCFSIVFFSKIMEETMLPYFKYLKENYSTEKSSENAQQSNKTNENSSTSTSNNISDLKTKQKIENDYISFFRSVTAPHFTIVSFSVLIAQLNAINTIPLHGSCVFPESKIDSETVSINRDKLHVTESTNNNDVENEVKRTLFDRQGSHCSGITANEAGSAKNFLSSAGLCSATATLSGDSLLPPPRPYSLYVYDEQVDSMLGEMLQHLVNVSNLISLRLGLVKTNAAKDGSFSVRDVFFSRCGAATSSGNTEENNEESCGGSEQNDLNVSEKECEYRNDNCQNRDNSDGNIPQKLLRENNTLPNSLFSSINDTEYFDSVLNAFISINQVFIPSTISFVSLIRNLSFIIYNVARCELECERGLPRDDADIGFEAVKLNETDSLMDKAVEEGRGAGVVDTHKKINQSKLHRHGDNSDNNPCAAKSKLNFLSFRAALESVNKRQKKYNSSRAISLKSSIQLQKFSLNHGLIKLSYVLFAVLRFFPLATILTNEENCGLNSAVLFLKLKSKLNYFECLFIYSNHHDSNEGVTTGSFNKDDNAQSMYDVESAKFHIPVEMLSLNTAVTDTFDFFLPIEPCLMKTEVFIAEVTSIVESFKYKWKRHINLIYMRLNELFAGFTRCESYSTHGGHGSEEGLRSTLTSTMRISQQYHDEFEETYINEIVDIVFDMHIKLLIKICNALSASIDMKIDEVNSARSAHSSAEQSIDEKLFQTLKKLKHSLVTNESIIYEASKIKKEYRITG